MTPLFEALSRLGIEREYAPGELEQCREQSLRPLPRLNYTQLLELAAMRFGDDHVLFEFPTANGPGACRRLSVGALRLLADRFAKALISSGLRRGDSIAVWSPPSLLWLGAMFGAAQIGVRVAGLNTRYRSEELRQVLTQLDPRLVLVATGFLDIPSAELVTAGIPHSHPGSGGTAVLTTRVGELDGTVEGWLHAGAAVSDAQSLEAAAAVTHRDAALVQFTSGSTGTPKGVLISQSGSIAAAHYGAEAMGLNQDDRLYSPLPFFHIGGTISTVLATVTSGCRSIIPLRFDAPSALRDISQQHCTAFQGHGALWRMLLDEFREHPVATDRLRKGWASGDAAFLQAVHDELGVTDLINMYGSSESGTIACTLPSDPLAQRLATLGRPTPGTRSSVREPESGREVPAGSPGELWLQGTMSLLGYLGAVPGSERDTDGWVHTGDLVQVIDGRLVYCGRTDDRLKPGGENVSIVEIEEFLARDPGILEAVVVGIPDRRLGEVPAAVVRVARADVTEDAILTRCRAEIAGFKVPRHVWIVAAVPALDTGKTDRRRVREELLHYLRDEKGAAL
jgi:fatty-acyl-CoA synthase